MSIVIGVGKHRMEIQNGDVEIAHIRQYRIYQEGNRTPVTSYDDIPKNLKLTVSDGVVEIVITSSSGEAIDEATILQNYVPDGYELLESKEAAKMIKGVKGRYHYFFNKSDRRYIALVSRGSGRPGRIALGSLDDHSSTLYQVLEKLPKDKPFYKAELNSLLPAKIVENRQPIKAALDILEREGFVSRSGKKIGVSEEYVREKKPVPKVGLDRHIKTDKP